MPVDSRCPGTVCCNDPITRDFRGCYDPTQCEGCVNGVVVRNDPDLLRATCKLCVRSIDQATGRISLDVSDVCRSWEDCCYGTCYNLVCEKCNHTTKLVENKCADSGKTCCKNPDGSVAECYDPTDCKECVTDLFGTQTGVVRPTVCTSTTERKGCCIKSGLCYNIDCQDCDTSTGKITDKCKLGQKCCVVNDAFVGCANPRQCQYCHGTLGVQDSRTPNQIAQCYVCDPDTGSIDPGCQPNECCNGTCMTSCQVCTNNTVTDQCDSSHFCCDDECLPKDPNSTETCKGCKVDTDGSLYTIDNKCISRTDGKTACCNGVCFDPTCSRCSSGGEIVADFSKDSSPSCCGGHILQAGEACCKNSIIRREVYRLATQSCCQEALGDTGVYNDILQGCCPYGNNGNNTIYDKTTYKCCSTAKGPTRTYNFSVFTCCGDAIIDQYKHGCCSDGPPNQQSYKYKINCEECNGGSPRQLYDETLCQECRDSGSSITPDILVLDNCHGRSDGKINCCKGIGECYNPNNACETCKDSGLPTARLESVCDPGKTCCLGIDASGNNIYDCCSANEECCNGKCFDNRSTSCKDCVAGAIRDNKCIDNATGRTLCCNGECINPNCKSCTSNTPIEKCPDNSSTPWKAQCCDGPCYGPCQTCRLEQGNWVLQDDPDCDCCLGPSYIGSSSMWERCCSKSANQKCCLGQCVPSDYVECDNQCVPTSQCCNGQVITPDKICCNNQPYDRSVCSECCNNKCINSTQSCCNNSPIYTSSEQCCPEVYEYYNGKKYIQHSKHPCAIDSFCCGSSCCSTPCCMGKCCAEDRLKGKAECCNGYGGGCFFPSDCKRCNNGSINTTLSANQECCFGVPYSPRDCEKCENNIAIPYTPPFPNCYCSNGSNICNCPIISTSCDSRYGWQGTGFIVENGMTLSITASGTVIWVGDGASPTSGPDGIAHPFCSDLRFLHEALLGQVGNGPVFLIGSSYNGIPGGTGELRLITNDDCRGDNNGSYQVTITCI